MPTPDLLTRAARFFLLAEHASRFCWSWTYGRFWNVAASSPREITVVLPALAAAVKMTHSEILPELVRHPLPDVLSPEAVPWHAHLVKTWERHRASSDARRQNLALLALVRLDGCGMPDEMQRPSRLPEWLAEAKKIASGEWWVGATGRSPVPRAGYEPARTEPARIDLEALAALAAWRAAPRVITPPETLREWVYFWQQVRQSESPLVKGIAAKALLNLPEADLRAASIGPYGRVLNPPLLLRELTAAIPAAAERTTRSNDYNYLSMLNWQPAPGTAGPAAEAGNVARAWLNVAWHNYCPCRRTAWQQLIHWDRTGILTACGIDLLPHVARAVQTEKGGDVLWELAQWMPDAGREEPLRAGPAAPLLQEMETGWQQHRQSEHWLSKPAGWLVSIRLHQAGLAAESPKSFRKAYMSAVARESDSDVLSVLARWSPGAEAPAAFHRKWRQRWQSRLEDEDEYVRQASVFALLRQAWEQETGEMLRRAALEVWSVETEEATTERHILETAVSRLHDVRARLAAGEGVDFEEEPVAPAHRHRPLLALPLGRITDATWEMENGEWEMKNEKWKMKNEWTKPANHPTPEGPTR